MKKRYNKVDKKYYNVPVYGKKTVENSKTNYVPSLLLSVNFLVQYKFTFLSDILVW